MDQILAKMAWNKNSPSDAFLTSLHFAEDLATIENDFWEDFNKQLKQLITESADVTEETHGLPPYRETLDHKVKLTGYQLRHRVNIYFSARIWRVEAPMHWIL
jgi:hypothetical protein